MQCLEENLLSLKYFNKLIMNYAEFEKRFKHGDKVTCTIDGIKITDARISINISDDVSFICQNETDMSNDCDNRLEYRCVRYLFAGDEGDSETINRDVKNLKLVKKEKAEHLEVGDIIIDEDDDTETMILSISGKVIVRSCWDDFDDVSEHLTFNEINEYLSDGDWEIKQEEIVEEVEELTMEEVCKEMGREIKIKK